MSVHLLGTEFEATLSKFGYAIKDGDVKTRFTITYTVTDAVTHDFLATYAAQIDPPILDCFNNLVWDKLSYTKNVWGMNVKFDAMDVTADFLGINVSVKETKDGLVTKYDINFEKEQDKDEDTVFATYLKRKEEDEDGKMQVVKYICEVSQ